ncbi:MAG: hypothetical protein WAL35_09490 [Acidimicrobiales bacterium]
MLAAVLRQSFPFDLDNRVVSSCLDNAGTGDALFAKGWRTGPASLTRRERCSVAPVTGRVAESVTEILLDLLDWRALWHFTGPGRHGVDLVFLAPSDLVVAIEVKGTLVSRRIPRLSRREVAQMSVEWVDKGDNPGMVELGLESVDVYGGVVAVNFADATWRTALTTDFVKFLPVATRQQLADPSWLTRS